MRVRAYDPQSFIGWLADLPWLAAPHRPFRLSVALVELATGRVVLNHDVFRSERMIDLLAGQHYAPGTEQNLPANVCMQTHGGFGFANEYDIERKFRETRLYQVAPISTNLIFSYVAEHVLGLPKSF